MSALRALAEIENITPGAVRLLRDTNYSWMADCYVFAKALVEEAKKLVKRLRQ